MLIKQLSIEHENIPGVLARISEILGIEGVNIRAISVTAGTSQMGAIRFVVDDPIKATNILSSHEYQITQSDVLAVETPDHPGGLNAILKPLKEADINVHYLYPYLGRVTDQAIVILGVDDIKKAEEVLNQNWVHMYGKEIYNM